MANSYFQGYCDSLIQSPDFISFSRRVYDIVGRNAPAAMILERICYWHGTSAKTGKSRLMVESDGHLWLAKNYTDWEEECCVNASTARKALDRLEELGVIETKIGKFQGVNSVLIRVIPEQFEYLSNMVGASVQNGHLPSVQNGHLHIQESKTIQESTAITLEFQKDEKQKTLIDPHTKERVLTSESVTRYEQSHPYLKWFRVTDGRLVDSRPYNDIETYYTLPKNAQLVRAYHRNEKWVLLDAHSFLAHMTANKEGNLLPYGDKSAYMPILALWADVNLSDRLLTLSVNDLYRVWLRATDNGHPDKLKYFPAKPLKVLSLLTKENSNE